MNLIADLAAPPQSRPAGKSTLDMWLENQDENVQAAVKVALINPAWGHVALGAKLAEYGAPKMSANAVKEWRKKHGWTA